MSWKSALAGGALGALIGGPLGAVLGGVALGAAIGHFAGEAISPDQPEEEPPARPVLTPDGDRKKALFVAALLTTFAALAKADGRISRSETLFVRDFVDSNFREEDREAALEIFENAKTNPASYQDYLDQLDVLAGDDRDFKQFFLGILCDLAMSDGELHTNELRILHYAENCFAMPGYIDAFFRFGEGAALDANVPEELYYDLLGCTPAANDEELKAAYEKKMLDFQPENADLRGVPEEFAAFAGKELSRIRQAYEMITRKRAAEAAEQAPCETAPRD